MVIFESQRDLNNDYQELTFEDSKRKTRVGQISRLAKMLESRGFNVIHASKCIEGPTLVR